MTQERLDVAVHAVESAVGVTNVARRLLVEGRIAAVTKSDASPVTVADFASQAIIVRALSRAFGDLRILAEESDAALRSDPALLEQVVSVIRSSGVGDMTADEVVAALSIPRADPRDGPCWTLDPVDGTKGFLRGGQYAIALAWLENGAPQIAAMACPCLDPTAEDPSEAKENGVIFSARGGAGTRMQNVSVSRPDWTGERVRLALSVESAHGDADAALILARKVARDVRPLRLDSCAKYGLVATGAADAYLRLPRGAGGTERVWDHAAGALVAMEAGCTVCDASGKPLDFGQGRLLSANAGILVAPPSLAKRLVRQ